MLVHTLEVFKPKDPHESATLEVHWPSSNLLYLENLMIIRVPVENNPLLASPH